MENCLQCNKPLQHVLGRKQKSFCNVNCRNKYFYAQRKKTIADAKAHLISLPPDYFEVNKAAVLAKIHDTKPIFPQPHKKPKQAPNNDLDASIDFVNQHAQEAYDSRPWPKNLEELKKMCPSDLVGLERSNWISTERQKYGI